jgi:hypothetical protein
MVYQHETKLQGWRALAIFEDGSQCLIYLGRSTAQVRAGYAAAFMEILDEEERAQVRSISLQCWQGAADEGRWIAKTTLAIPTRMPLAVTKEDEEEEEAQILSLVNRKKALSA